MKTSGAVRANASVERLDDHRVDAGGREQLELLLERREQARARIRGDITLRGCGSNV